MYPFQQLYPPFNNYLPHFRNLPPLPKSNPLFNKFICATLSESTPPYQIGRIHPPLFNNYMQPTQNLQLPPKIYPPPFSTTICNTPRSYPSLREYTPSLFKTTICNTPRFYHPLPEYNPPFQQLYATLPEFTPLSQNILPPPPFQQL